MYNLLLATQKSSSSAVTTSSNALMQIATDGSSGKTNSSFIDSSVNNATILTTGTPIQNTFTPYGSNWSTYFSGASYLTFPNSGSATYSPGTHAFTVEGWFNLTTLPTGTGASSFILIEKGVNATVEFGTAIQYSSSNYQLELTTSTNGSTYVTAISSNITLTPGTWNHFAFVFSGTTYTMYFNGVNVGTGSYATLYTGTGVYSVGANPSGGGPLNGYMSNVRVVIGTEVYTANFTPPTSPLTAITGTTLLSCNSYNFNDTSSNKFAATVTNTPAIKHYSPFGNSYTQITTGGSCYLNGSSYVSGNGGNAVTQFAGSFTTESWVYLTSFPTDSEIIYNWTSGNASQCSYIMRITNTGNLQIVYGMGGSNVQLNASSGTIILNSWNHVAVTRNSSNLINYWINGVKDSVSTSVSGTFNQSGIGITFGCDGSYFINGYLADVRINNTTAIYTANFTPPTAPITAVSGTNMLLNFQNGGILDEICNEPIVLTNVTTSTIKPSNALGSMSFNGTSSYFLTTNNPDFYLPASMNWTISTEIYVSSVTTTQCVFCFSNASSTYGSGINMTGYLNSGKLQFEYSTGSSTPAEAYSTTAITANAWYKTSWVYTASNQTMTFYINDVSAGSVSITGFVTPATTARMTVGRTDPAIPAGSAFYFTGNMTNFTITRGADVA